MSRSMEEPQKSPKTLPSSSLEHGYVPVHGQLLFLVRLVPPEIKPSKFGGIFQSGVLQSFADVGHLIKMRMYPLIDHFIHI